MIRKILAVAILVGLSGPALSHNGEYVPQPGTPVKRKPKPTVPSERIPAKTDVPVPPGWTATPRRTGTPRPGAVAPSGWSLWWRWNRARLVPIGIDDGPPDPILLVPALKALRAAAVHANDDIATSAIVALGKLRDGAAVALLQTILADRSLSPVRRESAVIALGLAGAGSREVLTRLSKDSSETAEMRASGVLALGLSGDVAALPSVLKAAADPKAPPAVRHAARVALGLLGEKMAAADLARDLGWGQKRETDVMLRAFSALGLSGIVVDAGRAGLGGALTDPVAAIRRQAALSLSAYPPVGGPDPRLLELLRKEQDPRARGYAVVALAEMSAPGTHPAATEAWAEGAPALTPFAAVAIGILGRRGDWGEAEGRAATFLRLELIDDPDPDMAGAIATSLALLGDRKVAGHLVELMRSGTGTDLRGHAAVALGILGNRDALPALREVLAKTSDPALMREVALGLRLMKDPRAEGLLLARLAKTEPESIRTSVAVAAGRTGSPGVAGRELLDLLGDEEESPSVRACGAIGLGRLLGESRWSALARIAQRMNPDLALGSILEAITMD